MENKRIAIGSKIKYNGDIYIVRKHNEYGYGVEVIGASDPMECATEISYNNEKWGRIEVIAEAPEIPNFKEGDEVVFKTQDGVWHYGVFKSEDDEHWHLEDGFIVFKKYDMILPYDGNKHLIGTQYEYDTTFIDTTFTTEEKVILISLIMENISVLEDHKDHYKSLGDESDVTACAKRIIELNDIIAKLK